jgi:hypothetical protein
MVRYYGLYANAHRGKVRKASLASSPLRIVEEELRCLPSKGWAAMIRKDYEVDPMTCPNSEASLGLRSAARSAAALQYSRSSVSCSMSGAG